MQRLVAWIAPQTGHHELPSMVASRCADGAATLRRALEESIVHVVDASADSIPQDALASVVVACELSDAELDLLLRRRWNQPVLWLVADDIQEGRVLRSSGPGQDAAVASHRTENLIARLMRLQSAESELSAVAWADVDQLTGLMNRRAFGRLLRRALKELLPGDCKALVHVDLDGFKQINDRFGHDVGDRLLAAVGQVMSQTVDQEDHLARMGGDEFAVLMSRSDSNSIVRDAKSLLHAIREQAKVSQAEGLVVRASAGLALLRPGLTEPQLYRQVDNAAYEAKHQGGCKLVHFELIHEDAEGGPEADLVRFQEVTRMFSDRMNRMVNDVGRRLIESAQKHAQFDALTGARNRGFFNERLPAEIERARTSGATLAIAMIDIDHFHDVNVKFGWTSGDAVLQHFVQVASEQLRVTDWLGRYGGEEFVLVLPGAGLQEAEAVAERLRSTVERTEFRSLDGRLIPITLSIGVSMLSGDISDGIDFCTKAGSACLHAKESGRNRVVAIA